MLQCFLVLSQGPQVEQASRSQVAQQHGSFRAVLPIVHLPKVHFIDLGRQERSEKLYRVVQTSHVRDPVQEPFHAFVAIKQRLRGLLQNKDEVPSQHDQYQ